MIKTLPLRLALAPSGEWNAKKFGRTVPLFPAQCRMNHFNSSNFRLHTTSLALQNSKKSAEPSASRFGSPLHRLPAFIRRFLWFQFGNFKTAFQEAWKWALGVSGVLSILIPLAIDRFSPTQPQQTVLNSLYLGDTINHLDFVPCAHVFVHSIF